MRILHAAKHQPKKKPRRRSTIEDRLKKLIYKPGPKSEMGGKCWIWKGNEQLKFNHPSKGVICVVRLLQKMKRGTWPEGLLLNRCGQNLCVNPRHYIDSSDGNLFWEKVDKTKSGCWNWKGFIDDFGYGHFGRNGKIWNTHRYSWFLENGPIPKDILVCHHCDNPSCVNPDHLYLGTQKDNMHDASVRKRWDRKGSKNPQSKLTELKVKEIRLLCDEGDLSLEEIADKYKVSAGTIRGIRSRRSWRHVG